MPRPKFDHITTASHLSQFCAEVSDAHTVAFDTEFVSEDTYRPQLCLIQVAAAGRLAVIDPLEIETVDPFWNLLAKQDHTTVVHAGREEFRFCSLAIDSRPAGWFDTQLAAAFVGMEYPAAYNTLVSRMLDVSLPKGETRTDWRRRPLSERQLDYALQDVMYLEQLAKILAEQVDRLGRRAWLDEDTERWQTQLEAYDQEERWVRVSGIANLSRRSLAIVRELWRWRDAEAQRRDRPPKQLLRDDLIVELAKRKSADPKGIRSIRGMERGNYKRHVAQFSECIARGLEVSDQECPRLPRRPPANTPQFTLLGQFINSVLGCICRSVNLAPTLVGTVQDVRDLVAYHLETGQKDDPPVLARGWRAEVVGRVIDDVLQGKLAVRVANPLHTQPLEIAELPASSRDE